MRCLRGPCETDVHAGTDLKPEPPVTPVAMGKATRGVNVNPGTSFISAYLASLMFTFPTLRCSPSNWRGRRVNNAGPRMHGGAEQRSEI